MELIVLLLVPFPLGFAVRSRTTAYLAYIAVHAFVWLYYFNLLPSRSSYFGQFRDNANVTLSLRYSF